MSLFFTFAHLSTLYFHYRIVPVLDTLKGIEHMPEVGIAFKDPGAVDLYKRLAT